MMSLIEYFFGKRGEAEALVDARESAEVARTGRLQHSLELPMASSLTQRALTVPSRAGHTTR